MKGEAEDVDITGIKNDEGFPVQPGWMILQYQ
jgi:hypothetical protein